MSIVVATGTGARAGVLVKNADALEALSKVTVLVVDKTGTLTEGKPKVRFVEIAEGFGRHRIIANVAAAELASEHPLARAIVEHACSERAVEGRPATGIEAIRGKGLSAEIDGGQLLFGTSGLLEEHGVTVSEAVLARADDLRAEGATIAFAAMDGRYAGLWAVADPVKPSARESIRALRALGIHVVMATGDAKVTALAVARPIGLDESDVFANILPENRARVVERLSQGGEIVAMAGDGINDAVALTLAHVGIAMGTGADVAVESAGVTLVRGDLRGIERAVRLGRATSRNIRENLVLAFGYNALAIPIAAGALYPALGVILSPMIAAAAMSLSSVSVIANALRLRRVLLS
jgi:Cu+-exporting ATPase